MAATEKESTFTITGEWKLLIALAVVLALLGLIAYKHENSPEYLEKQRQAAMPRNERMLGHEAVLPDELKGCKVFRVFDGQKSLYMTSCTDTVTTQWSEYCGKNCFRQESVTTERRGDI